MFYIKCMNTFRYLIFSALAAVSLLTVSGCRSFYGTRAVEPPDSSLKPLAAVKEIELTVEMMDSAMGVRGRNIDDPEWIMSYFNYLAGRDLYLIEEIHFNLKYSALSDTGKKEFLSHYLNPEIGELAILRSEMYEEVRYLVEYSEILKDIPWMLRSRFNEKSEFSYWYVMYVLKSINPLWVDSTILPVLLDLIPLDEITAVTYLWLKNPESMAEMDQEILLSGYPWTTLLHIKRIKSEIREIIQELYLEDEKPPWRDSEDVLI